MSLRTRAHARLERPVLDFSRWERREPARRLVSREVSPIADRPRLPEPSASIGHPTEAVRDMRIRAPGQPTPNAPLLMRIVRTPFSLAPGRTARTTIPRGREPLVRDRHVGPGRVFRDLVREIRSRPGLMTTVDHRPAFRPRPFARGKRSVMP
jgi:hypothetical protein